MNLKLGLLSSELKGLPWRILTPLALIVLGGMIIGLALAADVVGVGARAGLGGRQIMLLVAGGLSVLIGLGLATSTGWWHVGAWRQYLRTSSASASILLVAVWFGLLVGWLQGAIRVGLYLAIGTPMQKGTDFIWMAPLANLVIFMAAGLALTVLNLRWPRLISRRNATAILAFMFLVALFSMIPRLAWWAKVILAMGLAVQIARLSATHRQGFVNLVRYSIGWPALLGKPAVGDTGQDGLTPDISYDRPTRREFLIGAGSAIAVAAVGVNGWKVLEEHRKLAAFPMLAKPQMPNILFIVLDTVRAQSMSMHGYARPTSLFLERFGSQGVVYESAISPCCWTLPSHASMFTGRHPHELSAGRGVPLDQTYPTLAEVMAAQGYLTAGFVSNTSYCSREFGLSRGFQHYEDYPISLGELAQSSGYDSLIKDMAGHKDYISRKPASQISANFLRWQSRIEGRPFFAFLNYFDAHAPYVPPRNFAVQYAGKPHPEGRPFKLEKPIAPTAIQELNDAYDACVAYLDYELELLFEELSTKRILDDTLVLVTSDHGEEFYEHHLLEHGNALYLTQTHVPLMMRFPSTIPAGTRVEMPVGLRNLATTISDLVGIQLATPFPGESLAVHWQSDRVQDVKPILAEVDVLPGFPNKGPIKSVLIQPYHYIFNSDGREELYMITSDPLEQHDLAGTEVGRETIPPLRAALGSLLKQEPTIAIT